MWYEFSESADLHKNRRKETQMESDREMRINPKPHSIIQTNPKEQCCILHQKNKERTQLPWETPMDLDQRALWFWGIERGSDASEKRAVRPCTTRRSLSPLHLPLRLLFLPFLSLSLSLRLSKRRREEKRKEKTKKTQGQNKKKNVQGIYRIVDRRFWSNG